MSALGKRITDWIDRHWLGESEQKVASVEKAIREGRTDRK